MPVRLDELLRDLAEETVLVDDLVSGLDDAGWDKPTPAEGWGVRDQVSHLAYFDDAASLAAVNPEQFSADARRLEALRRDFAADVAEQYRQLAPIELLAWFRLARRRFIETSEQLDPRQPIPWYGPPMSVASSVTARIMETWAHGQDIADALGVTREPSARLRHVAHLGVQTMGFAFTLHGLAAPEVPIRVELDAPDGIEWTWGDPDAEEVVRGRALEFCLVVTQRRHAADTELVTRGPVATRWLTIAQAFAGPPGSGRPACRRGHSDTSGRSERRSG